MNRLILALGLVTILTALAGVARADSGVTLERVSVIYTLPGFSQHELYHDAMAVCLEGRDTCEIYLEDTQAVPAWSMDRRTCESRAEVWGARLDEPARVLGCSADARVLIVDRGEL